MNKTDAQNLALTVVEDQVNEILIKIEEAAKKGHLLLKLTNCSLAVKLSLELRGFEVYSPIRGFQNDYWVSWNK